MSDQYPIQLPQIMFAELERWVGKLWILKSQEYQLSREIVDSRRCIELLKEILTLEGVEVALNDGDELE